MGEDRAVRTHEKAVLSTYQGRIKNVNSIFLDLTGYCENQLIDKSVQEVFHKLLRVNVDIRAIKPEDDPITCFIFTRALEPIEVTICIEIGSHEEIIIIDEKPNSRLFEKVHDTDRMFSDNKMGVCIISVPDLILLKTNDFYLDILNEPFNVKEKAIGQRIEDILSDALKETFFGKKLEDIIGNF